MISKHNLSKQLSTDAPSLIFLAKFFDKIVVRNFFLVKLLLSTLICMKPNYFFGNTSYGDLYLAKHHFIWRNFIWRRLATQIISLASSYSLLAQTNVDTYYIDNAI